MVREIVDLCRDWCLCLEDERNMIYQDYMPERYETVNLPHTWNAADTFAPSRGYWRGVGWYRKDFQSKPEWQGRRIILELTGFFCTAHIWLNGECVGYSADGFTGQSYDLTDLLETDGKKNTIAIRVDNRHDPELLPGKDIPDYVLYGGIYRDVFLNITNKTHLAERGIAIRTPHVSPSKATCEVTVEIAEASEKPSAILQMVLLDPSGKTVAEKKSTIETMGTSIVQCFEIDTPTLWSLENPALYTAVVTLKEADGTILDQLETSFGFRWFEFNVDGDFKLNGEKVFLKGVNRHQDFGGLGNALPERLQHYDAELIKELGGNFVRLSHYPQHTAFLDACDRLGILCFAEIASWQHIGGPGFAANAEAMMRAMIRRDKNHPSIVLWGLLNEGRSKSLFERLNEVVHECDPTRPTVYAENHPEEGTRLGTVNIPDVLGLNYKFPHLDEIRALWPDKKLFSSEHTNADYCNRGNEDAEICYLEALQNNFEILHAHPFLAGAALWCMHDYATDYRPTWPHHYSGAIDHVRLYKEAAHLLRAWWHQDLTVHIAGHWTHPGSEGKTRSIYTISNGERVELYMNGRLIGEKTGSQLLKWEIPYAPGKLTAKTRRGDESAEHTLETADTPQKLHLATSTPQIHADGRDVSLIDIRCLDASDRLAPQTFAVVLEIQGPATLGTIGGLPTAQLSAGLGRFAVRSNGDKGEIIVRAAAPGLQDAQISVRAE